ncbi:MULTISPECIES: ABC transporter ATP-binding protein [unclassified Rhizobium]|uniref:ABC transporter ATP-binding protein n=1 Tax=unclassified Rhizobium TaxID=2613769 RepID=UPI001ADAFC63|nr:ABC transporter ATP-binding protein [Rhizobium sp. 16-488-2b]MBO9177594.1 ABC transporter ATP-binding protein [Rhizobium sp. 16-488-2a]
MKPQTAPRLEAQAIELAYGKCVIAEDLSVTVPSGSFTAIVGPNACGKSTLLQALSRLLMPGQGAVLLDGRTISTIPAKEFARSVGLMPQSSVAPDGITVTELVACGRYPHQNLLRQWSRADEQAVSAAIEATGMNDLAGRRVNELSGGQRQRAWIAMVLAQETPLLLLDEPTTFLDIAHQMELMLLLERLNRERGYTIAAVLHDLNQACRHATHMIAMRGGRAIAEGRPGDIVTETLVREVFGLDSIIIKDPVVGTPLVVPRGLHHNSD